jgi:hypothetical protein
MESRIVYGLFFCGEMIDVDGTTGGYNLQAAFSTGYLAGESAVSDGWVIHKKAEGSGSNIQQKSFLNTDL